jgi:putative endonuclease
MGNQRNVKIKYYFYILQCKDTTLYCGSTNNLEKREKTHNAGKGSVYVKTHGGGRIVYSETYSSVGDAMRREIEVKKWSRIKKLGLVKGRLNKK